jgi:SAM-dependent methyltransferase
VSRGVAGLFTAALFQTGRQFARVTRVLNHLAAGTLTIDQLRTGIERTWEEFSARDSDIAAGLMRWEEEMLARFVTREDDVLLVGSGPGRDLVAMVAGGYRVTALEPARRAIATCRRQLAMRGLGAEIIAGFFEDVPLPRRFDVIIFSGCCYNFIPESRRRIAALRKAADHLTPGGRILVNFMTERSGHPLLIQLARLSATITRSDWRPERGDVLLPVDPKRALFHYEHPFVPGELEGEAQAAGLRAVERCEFPGAPVLLLEPIQPAPSAAARGENVERSARCAPAVAAATDSRR